MIRKSFVLSFAFLFAATAWAQANPKPGPEVKRLEYFIGTWSSEGDHCSRSLGTGREVLWH